MRTRSETDADMELVYAVNVAAFPTSAEAELVNRLRESTDSFISLVAEEESRIVGHILFSPVILGSEHHLKLMGLAPMAVCPENQKQAIGSALVEAGLKQCERAGIGAVVVLGHPEYYPRFGFIPASQFEIRSEYDVPDEVFMATEIRRGYLDNVHGTIRYHPAFAKL